MKIRWELGRTHRVRVQNTMITNKHMRVNVSQWQAENGWGALTGDGLEVAEVGRRSGGLWGGVLGRRGGQGYNDSWWAHDAKRERRAGGKWVRSTHR